MPQTAAPEASKASASEWAKDGEQLVALGFKRVVEHDDRAVAGVAPYVGEDFLRGQLLGVVAGDKVVHYYVVAVLDTAGLLPA